MLRLLQIGKRIYEQTRTTLKCCHQQGKSIFYYSIMALGRLTFSSSHIEPGSSL
jgi:aryl-alcohol dehydrogenase-like predicted oxidoreductase